MKKNREWKPLQIIVDDFNLNDYINPDLIKAIEESTEGKKVNAISLSILIDDDDAGDNVSKNADVVSFNHRTVSEQNKDLVVIDMNNEKTYPIIKKTFEKL